MQLFRTNPPRMIGNSLVFKWNRRDVNYRELLVVVIVIVIVTTGDTWDMQSLTRVTRTQDSHHWKLWNHRAFPVREKSVKRPIRWHWKHTASYTSSSSLSSSTWWRRWRWGIRCSLKEVPTWLDIVPPALEVSVLYWDASEIDLLLIVVHLVATATAT